MTILQELCDTLLVEKEDLLKFTASGPYRYKVYAIPKRNGKGHRTIAHPSKELKFVQRSLNTILFGRLPVHKSAFAYKKGIGIKENALKHANSRYLLKMDFRNFFNSITPPLFFRMLRKEGIVITPEEKELLTGSIFWRQHRKGALRLSVGAPTSPLISNFVMYHFDTFIHNYCEKREINYTRYADDITFSTKNKHSLFEIPKVVADSLTKNTGKKIKINEQKTVFSSKAHNRHVTGVTLSNKNELSIGRAKKRILSASVHRFSNNLLSEADILKLQGELSFAFHIDLRFCQQVKNKYGIETISRIKSYRKISNKI